MFIYIKKIFLEKYNIRNLVNLFIINELKNLNIKNELKTKVYNFKFSLHMILFFPLFYNILFFSNIFFLNV